MAQDFKICRLCLSKTKIFFNLNEDEHSTILEAITAIKVDPLDNSETSLMCLKCRLNLKLAYAIQQNIIKSYAEFENALESANPAPIKQELDLNYPELVIIKTRSQDAAHAPEVPFSCSACGQNFSAKTSLQRHYRHKHPDKIFDFFQVSFNCDSCTRSFGTESALEVHLDSSHKRKACPVCKKAFLLANYDKHLKWHDLNNTGPLVCHVCGNSAKSKDSLRMHIRLYHMHKGVTYKCGKCEKRFRCKRNVVAHENSMHGGGERTEMCEVCGKKFFTVETMRTHKNRVHLKIRKHPCEFCKRDFSSSYALKTHRRQHTNEKPYRCDTCGEGFKQRVSLKTHMSSKHNIDEERNVACEVCERKFASIFALMSHKRVHVKDSLGSGVST